MSAGPGAGGGPWRRAAGGFTLLELLAVIVVIGVLSAAALLSADLGGFEARAREEARRIRALVERLCEESVLFSRQQGVLVFAGGYAFAALGPEGWALRGERPFREHALLPGLHLELRMDGRLVEPADGETPQVVCYSSGDLTPFRLELRDAAGEIEHLISGNEIGELRLERIDAA